MKHHFVPEFLLDAWAQDTPAGRKLVEFRTDFDRVFAKRKAPGATGYQKDLYAAEGDVVHGDDRHLVETRILQRIDSDAARVRAKMLSRSELDAAERATWIRFLMAMRIRHPKQVSRFRTIGSDEARKEFSTDGNRYAELREEGDPPTLSEWVERNYPGMIANFGLRVFIRLLSDQGIEDKLTRLRWMHFHSVEARHKLLLSDTPLVLTSGIDSTELVVGMPISPCDAFFACRSSKAEQQLLAADPNAIVQRLNESVIWQASSLVYACNFEPRRFIENRIAQKRRSLS